MKYKLYCGDCLEVMKDIPDKSIDMILCDLPYSTTRNHWDCAIPLNDYVLLNNKAVEKQEFYLTQALNGLNKKEIDLLWKSNKKEGLWTHYNRIIKDNGAIVLFAQTPFDKILGNSNLKMLRYEWIWEKTTATGYLNAKKMPMKAHENILVFYKKLPVYNPQKTTGHKPTNYFEHKTSNISTNYGTTNKGFKNGGSTERYPRSVQVFKTDKQKCALHPTQKPVALCEFLIRTYTNPGATILDNTMGSGTVGVATLNVGEERKFIGIELDENYFNIAKKRIEDTEEELKNK